MTRALSCLAALALAGCAAFDPPPLPPPVPRPPMAAAAEPVPPPVVVAPPAAEPQAPPPPASPVARSRLEEMREDERVDLWQRVREGYEIADLNNELVRRWEQYYATRPDYMQRITTRGGRYLFHILEEIDRRGLPAELALLPFIESAFNPEAESRARASGMWQFMPATGRDYELEQNLFRDDRRSVIDSTRAALDYLQRLHKMFGDWHRALAAYNWGQGNVQRALTANRNAGLPATYEAIRMPDETRNYVPKLQAVKNLVARPQAFSVSLPPLGNHPHFVGVAIERDIDVALAAKLADLPLADFKALNPQMNKPVILAAGTPVVLLPYDNANRFLAEIAVHRGPMATWTAWVAPRTVKTSEAAQLVGMPEADLRQVNRIPERMVVQAGSTLLVPRPAHAQDDVAGRVADDARMVLSPEVRARQQARQQAEQIVTNAGRRGDSVVAVARRYGLTATQVAQWNGVASDARFKPGQRIMVMKTTAPTAAPRAAVRHAAEAKANAKAKIKTNSQATSKAKPKATAQAPTKAPVRKKAQPPR